MRIHTIALASLAASAQASVEFCHLLYSMADNDLESSIAGDLAELVANKDLMNDPHYQYFAYIDRHAEDTPELG